MKNIIQFLLVTLISAGCSETATGPGPLEPGLIGIWELKHTSGDTGRI